MQKLLLLGDEAIAQGALDAGISGLYAYPGTPSTEIAEYVHHSKEAAARGVKTYWSANEKTAVEGALGMSYAGKRTIVCMKHVGLNVAADPFMNSAVTGANGGIIVVAADDPSMHSSQNEQDSRVYGKFAMIPVLEPCSQQEAYDMTHYGLELSEKYKVPVLMRLTTRLAHSRAGVQRKAERVQNPVKLPDNPNQFMLLPALARKSYKKLLGTQDSFANEAASSGYNVYFDAPDKSKGVITCGLAYNYLLENYPDRKTPYPLLKICQYPLPYAMIKKIYDECEEIMVIEDGFPVVEEQIKGFLGLGKKIRGRLDGSIPRDGELNPVIAGIAAGVPQPEATAIPEIVTGRPPSLCPGCPHIDTYKALNDAIAKYSAGRVFADIGCYTLGFLPPYKAINTCVDMGASITMAKGAADAGLVPSVAVIGDSTFTHSGLTGLLDAVTWRSPITVCILDNGTTAMTGGQISPGTGKMREICAGIGVEPDHIVELKPLRKNHEEMVEVISKELEYPGVSVLIFKRECVVELNKRMREKFKNKTE